RQPERQFRGQLARAGRDGGHRRGRPGRLRRPHDRSGLRRLHRQPRPRGRRACPGESHRGPVPPAYREDAGGVRRHPLRRRRPAHLRRKGAAPKMRITELPAWQALLVHRQEMESRTMRDLFAQDPQRFERYSLQLGDLLFDYSKNRITDQTMALLFRLARERHVPEAIEAMFAGEKLNNTEKRAVLHVALRNRANRPICVDGQDVMPGVNAVLEKMRRFVDEVRSGQRRGYTGKPFTDVVSICIGGSHLGPRMMTRALAPYADGRLRVHFVTNVDPTNVTTTLRQVPAETTLFVIASKSFTTQETMLNAATARQWLVDRLGNEK